MDKIRKIFFIAVAVLAVLIILAIIGCILYFTGSYIYYRLTHR